MEPDQKDRAQPTFSIHLDDNYIFYAVTDNDLDELRNAGESSPKNYFIASFSLSLPLLINAAADIYNVWNTVPFPLTISIFLNSLVGTISLFFSIYHGVTWYKSHKSFNSAVDNIKRRPRHEMEISHRVREVEKYLEGEITGGETTDISPERIPNIPQRGIVEKIDRSK